MRNKPKTTSYANVVDTTALEYRILGWALDQGKTFDLTPDDFADDAYAAIMQACHDTLERYGSFDYILVGEVMRAGGCPDNVEPILRKIWEDRLPRDDLAISYARHLQSINQTFELRSALHDIANEPTTGRWDPRELRERAMDALRHVHARSKWRTVSVSEMLPSVLESVEERMRSTQFPGITTGFQTLDRKTGGFQDSDLTLIAARPAVGKTAMMCQMALAAHESRVAIISAEQPADQIVQRLIAQTAHVDAWRLRSPRSLSDDDWDRIGSAVIALGKMDIHIFDAPAPTVSTIADRVSEISPQIAFVDYVQRLKSSGNGVYERVSAIAQSLKELAREQGIPIVALAQLNRQGAKNAGMEHLKGSGDLEQEADAVILLERDEDADGRVNLILEKNRHGPTGEVELHFDGPTMRFFEAES